MLAYVGLGSNLGDREALLQRAVELIGAEPDVEVRAVSSFRETDPVGYLDQPPFLNGVCAVETQLAPELLARLLAIEARLGRTRTEFRATGRAPATSTCCCTGTRRWWSRT